MKEKSHCSETCSTPTRLVFGWLLPYLHKNECDGVHYRVLPQHKSQTLGEYMEKRWDFERRQAAPSLWRVIRRQIFFKYILYLTAFAVSELFFKMIQPYLIQKLLTDFNSITQNQRYLLAGLIFVASSCNSFIAHHFYLGVHSLGLQVKSSCCSLIYRKVLRLSQTADANSGQLVNMITNDAKRFDLGIMYLSTLPVAFVEIMAIVICMYFTVGVTVLGGIVFLVLFATLQTYLGKVTGRIRAETTKKTDERIGTLNKFISGINIIKIFACEQKFVDLIEKARELELRFLRKTTYIYGLNTAFMVFVNRTGIFWCVLTYAIYHGNIEAGYIYTVTSYFSILRTVLTVHLPFGLNGFNETKVSVRRIQEFLLKPEVQEANATNDQEKIDQEYDPLITTPEEKSTVEHLPNKREESKENDQLITSCDEKITVEKTDELAKSDQIHSPPLDEDPAILLENISVKFPSSEAFVLQDLTLNVTLGDFIGITGTVGTGKSTLLKVILNEIQLNEGTCKVTGVISYVPQEAWLFPASIRENITLGSHFIQSKYDEIITTCQLRDDFDSFSESDSTIVGNNTLSGGQKSRVNIARALYADADFYLFDDIFSSVDAKVGRAMLDSIKSYLSKKSVILVTHQEQYLEPCKMVYELTEGKLIKCESRNKIQNIEEIQNEQDEHQVPVPENKEPTVIAKVEPPKKLVTFETYKRYITSGHSLDKIIYLFVLFVVTQVSISALDYFLSKWTNLQDQHGTEINSICIQVYSSLMLILVVFSIARSLYFYAFALRKSKYFHKEMLNRLSRTPLTFFQVNAGGEIQNRLAKDIGFLDESIPTCTATSIQIALIVLGSFVLIIILNPWNLLPTLVILAIFVPFRRIFLRTSQKLKRHELSSFSPILTHLTSTMQGLSVIRAFGSQKFFTRIYDGIQDVHSAAFYYFLLCDRAFGFWLDLVCTVYMGFVLCTILFIGDSGSVGLAITESLNIVALLQFGIRQLTELENRMTSMERILEYCDLQTEMTTDLKPQNWPSGGQIEYRSVSLTYGGLFSLENVTCAINAGEKVAIVGRTGSGKSTFTSLLFRLYEYRGRITIDGVDIREVSVEYLRSRISMIPQRAALPFPTIRSNLDPFDRYDDSELWETLEKVQLKEVLQPLELHCKVDENGSNFSQGQKQLLYLAKTLLSKNKVIVLDEATANVDQNTDRIMQDILKKHFQNCTVITITHRLNALMDYDKIMVLDQGRIQHFGMPSQLEPVIKDLFSQFPSETDQ